MKNRFNLFLGTFAVIAMTQTAHADSATWNVGATDALWATTTNWSATPVPGTGDTATFSNAGGSVDVINLGTGVTIGNITFDLATVAAYTIGSGAVNSQTLTLNDSGAITANSTINANQLFNAALVLGTDATTQYYAITNNDTSSSLTFAGTITGGSTGTAGIKTLDVTSAGGLVTLSGVIGDGGATSLGLTKAGTGTLTLSGASTYTGATTVDTGTLNVTGSLGNGATTVNGGTLNLSGSLGNSATTVFSGAFLTGEGSIGATGSLTLDDGSNLRVDGSTAGALTVGSGATGNLSLNGTTTVILDNVPAAMSPGTNTLRVLNYNGTLTGSAANFTVSNCRNPVFSTATLSQVNLSIDSSALTWSGATGAWDINSTANWNSDADTFYQGDAVTFGDGGVTKTVAITGTALPTSVTFNNTLGNDYTISGIIGGATALSANGAGKVTLSGANTYTGATTVGAGTLLLTNTNATGAVSIASGAVLELTNNQPLTSPTSVTLSGAGTLRLNGTTSTGFGPFVFNLGSGAVIEVLTAGIGFNGGYGSNKNYTNNKADLYVATGATFGTSNTNVRMDALTGLGNINNSSGSTGGSFTFGVDSGSGNFGGVLQTTGGNKFAFTKLGTGTQTLSGINTYASSMNVNAGVLALSGSGTLGGGTAPVAMGGGQLDLGATSQPVGAVTVTAAFASGDTIRNGSLTGTSYAASNATGTAVISANLLVNATAGFAKSNAGTVTLSGSNTYTGATTISAGTLQIDAAAALPSGSQINLSKSGVGTGTLKLNTSGTNTFANTFANFNSSSGSAGGGTPNIQNAQGDNTVSGNMNIGSFGGNGVNLQSDAGMLRISGTLTNTYSTGYRAFDFSGAGDGVFSGQANNTNVNTGVYLLKNGAGTWSITGTNSSFTGGVVVLQGVLNAASVADTGTNSSIGAGGAITLTGQGTSGSLQYTGSTAVTTNHALNVAATGGTLDASGTGSGTIKFTGTFTATDPAAFNVTYTSGSTVATNAASNVPGTVAGGVMSITSANLPAGTTITSISGNSYTLSQAATATSAVSTTFGANVARTLTLTGSNVGNNEISSNLANSVGGGVLSVSKSGSGTWVLSGTNTYTGATAVTLGTLALVGGSHTSPITVSSGATLGFTLGSPTTSTSTVAFSCLTAKVAVTGTPVAATLMTAANITGTPVLDPAIPGFVLAIEDSGTTLKLKAAPAGGYTSWASTNGVPGQAANLDHDNDGVSNGVEYFIGGPTGPTTGFTALPSVITVAGVRSITWVKGPGYLGNYPADFVVETSTTLAAGSWFPESSPGTVAISGSNVTYTFPAGPVKKFARLKVTGP